MLTGGVFFLQAEIALADHVDLRAQSVVIADFPQHSSVGGTHADKADGAEEGEGENAVQNAVRNMNAP